MIIYIETYRCSRESARALLYPESLRLLSCRNEGNESQGERLCPEPGTCWVIMPWPDPDPIVELPERQPSEWRNHWARADSPMQDAQRELEKLKEITLDWFF